MFKQIGDLNVSYEVAGAGYPLVMLHGGGARAKSFEEMVPILAKEFKVHLYDQRGFGATVRPPQPALSHELWRDDALRFMDSFGLRKVALAGWSMGAATALNFVLAYPDRVSHLILIGAGGGPGVPAGERSGFEERRRLIESGATQQEIVAKTFEFTKKSFSRYSIEHNAKAVEHVRQEHLSNNPQSYLEMLKAGEKRENINPRLGEIKCPTLILVGDEDSRTPVPNSEAFNRAITDSFMKIIPNCGHHYGYEQPEATSRAMISFLKAFQPGHVTAAAG